MTTLTLTVPDHLATLLQEIGDQLPLVLEMGLSRLAPLSTQAYMEVVALFTQTPSAETLAKFRFSEAIEKRIEDLLAANDADGLSKAEEVELARLTQLEGQLQLVKAKALIALRIRKFYSL